MALPSVRNYSRSTGSSAAATTVNLPTGVVNGDILYVAIYKENSAAITTVPSGWTLEITASNSDHWVYLYSKRASSEPSSWQWAWTGAAFQMGMCIAVQNGPPSGSYNDATPVSAIRTTTNAVTIPNVSITTVTASCLLIWIGSSLVGFNNTKVIVPTGFAAGLLGDTALPDLIFATGTASSTGVQTATGATGNNTNGRATSLIIAIPSATIACEQEGFIYKNDDGSETTATNMAAQDTNVTQPNNTQFRLRFLINTTGASNDIAPQIEYSINGKARRRLRGY